MKPESLTGAAPHFVHIVEELQLALPFWRYYELFRQKPYSFLLDSARDPAKLGKFSFMGGEPDLVYRAKRVHGAKPSHGAEISVTRYRTSGGDFVSPPQEETRTADVFSDLATVFAEYQVPQGTYKDMPVPLPGGAVGYFGYECNYFVETLPDIGKDDLALPDVCLMFTDRILAHDHVTGKTYLSLVGRGSSEAEASSRADVERSLLLARIAQFEKSPPAEWTGPKEPPTTSIIPRAHADQDTYVRTVLEAKEHIYAGTCYEVCTTHRLEASYDGDPWNLYCELRRINPAPFASFLNFPWAQVVSSSPERFISVDTKGNVESRPIKGTRPRGKTPEEDASNKQDLLNNEKDRAENVMIVDLVRNDLGRVCEIDSVHVPELTIVEEYATVMQLVSTIRGKLRPDQTVFDLIKAAFPGGSMTGAPKIEAMKIIDALEPYKRGIYSGGIGYIDYRGVLDLSIVIRTFVVKDGNCYFNVGGAIVADSEPVAEYQETMDKARALIRALEGVKRSAAYENANY